jgi:predicted dinucleotide-binding enzyme
VKQNEAMSKKTIAIIGAAGTIGSVIAKSLAKGNYRLLLFEHETKSLDSLAREIRKQIPHADIDCMACAADASWEADIIISTVSLSQEKELAKKIEPFANRKILVSIPSKYNVDESKAIEETKGLQKLLTGTNVVNLFNISYNTEGVQNPALITGNNDEVLKTVKEILKVAGFDHVHSVNYRLSLEKII